MLPEELVALVKKVQRSQAEGPGLEVKTAHEDCPKLYDTLSSFSNQAGGGTILFGLSEKENFAVIGVKDVQSLQKSVTEQCTDQMQPPIRMVFTAAEIDGKMVCAAEIPGLDIAERPCYYKGRGRVKGSYIRVGDGDFVMTDLELYSFEAFRRHLQQKYNSLYFALFRACFHNMRHLRRNQAANNRLPHCCRHCTFRLFLPSPPCRGDHLPLHR